MSGKISISGLFGEDKNKIVYVIALIILLLLIFIFFVMFKNSLKPDPVDLTDIPGGKRGVLCKGKPGHC